jgi:hypothetical protein
MAMDYGFYLWYVATHKVPFSVAVPGFITSIRTYTTMRLHAAEYAVSPFWAFGAGPMAGSA